MNNQQVQSFVPRGRLLRDVPEDVLSTTVIGAYCQWLRDHRNHDFPDYNSLWHWSVNNLSEFWASIADYFDLDLGKPISVMATGDMEEPGWFPGSSVSYAAHALRHHGSETALVGVSQTRERVEITRDGLIDQVARCAVGLKRLGVGRGDRVAAYLPNIPEAIVAFLATASIGAVWVSCAPEFGVRAVVDRFSQVKPVILLAVGGYQYADKVIDVRSRVEEIKEKLVSVKHVVNVPYLAGKDAEASLDWGELLAIYKPLTFEKVPFNHPLYVLFSSGTTGLPKAIIHGHGGILVEHAKALGLHNDVKNGDVFFWFSTTGWMVWNYSVSALIHGAAVVCYDGNPMSPNAEALWKLAQDEKMTFFGNSASFYMACRGAGLHLSDRLDLSSIRGVGSTGSSLPVEGFEWIDKQFGSSVIIASAAGGTDICSSFVSASPMVPIRAGEIAAPNLGCYVAAHDGSGNEVFNEPGEMVVKTPMPSMPVGLWGDDGTRLRATYYEQNPDCWTHGDWTVIFDDNASVISGRSDTTLNRGGVRLGVSDFYSVVEEIDGVADSLVVHLEGPAGGMGQLLLFVTSRNDVKEREQLTQQISLCLKEDLSPRHVPDRVVWLSAIPRTLTGKKIEVPVKKILQGSSINKVVNIDSLTNAEALEEILALQAAGWN